MSVAQSLSFVDENRSRMEKEREGPHVNSFVVDRNRSRMES